MELNVKSADELKKLRGELRFGDVAQCAKDTGFSTQTVQAAIGGKIHTQASSIILSYCDRIIADRKERLEYLKTVIRPMYKTE